MIDHLTKYSTAKILHNKSGKSVVEAILLKWISVFGPSQNILSDNGKEFVNLDFNEMCDLLDIKHRTTPSYSPISSGLVERHNGILAKMTQKLKEGLKISNEVALSWALQAKNSLMNVDGFSPYQQVFGFNPKSTQISTCSEGALRDKTPSSIVRDMLNTMNRAREEYIKSENSGKLKRALKCKTENSPCMMYKTGDIVLFRRRIDDQWIGPVEVVGQMGKTVVVNHGGQLIKVHHQQVKKKVSLTEEVSKNKGNRNKCVEVKEKIGYVRSESEDDSSSESSSSEDSVCSNLPELEGNEPLPEEVAEVLEVSIEEQSYRGEHITEEREVGDQRSVEKDLEENVESEEKTASETDENEEYKSTEEHDDEEGQSDKDVLAAQLLGSWREVTYHSGDHMSLKAGNRITFEDEKGAIQDVVVTSRSGKATGAYYNRFNVKDSITGREYKINLGDETKVSKNTVLIYREEEIALHFVEDDVYAICVPKTRYGEAEILEAMEIELETLKGFNSYEEVHDTGQKCLSTRWIITEKPGRTTGSRIYKARLVCRGFEEEMSNAADSPTADKVDLRLFLSLASTFG